MSDNALVKLDAARAALAECKTVMEAKGIADMAEAARVYLERTHASAETVNHATEIRLLAERQMGEFLKRTPKNPGGNPKLTPTTAEGVARATISEIGITYQQSSRAQKLADIPPEEFRDRIAVAKIDGKLSTAALLKTERRSPARFDPAAWKRQVRSVMTSWLKSVPASEREQAADFLAKLPPQIIEQIK